MCSQQASELEPFAASRLLAHVATLMTGARVLPHLPLERRLKRALRLRAAEAGRLVALDVRAQVVGQGARDGAARDGAGQDRLAVAQHVAPQVVLPLERACAAIVGTREGALRDEQREIAMIGQSEGLRGSTGLVHGLTTKCWLSVRLSCALPLEDVERGPSEPSETWQ